jgi:hypothetical protein
MTFGEVRPFYFNLCLRRHPWVHGSTVEAYSIHHHANNYTQISIKEDEPERHTGPIPLAQPIAIVPYSSYHEVKVDRVLHSSTLAT